MIEITISTLIHTVSLVVTALLVLLMLFTFRKPQAIGFFSPVISGFFSLLLFVLFWTESLDVEIDFRIVKSMLLLNIHLGDVIRTRMDGDARLGFAIGIKELVAVGAALLLWRLV